MRLPPLFILQDPRDHVKYEVGQVLPDETSLPPYRIVTSVNRTMGIIRAARPGEWNYISRDSNDVPVYKLLGVLVALGVNIR